MNNRMKMRSAVTLVLVALFVVPSVVVLAPVIVYAAPTGVATLTRTSARRRSTEPGQERQKTCTITPSAVGYSIGTSFTIPSKTTLAIIVVDDIIPIGEVTISSSVTITNHGIINNSVIINNYGTIVNLGGGIPIPSCPVS